MSIFSECNEGMQEIEDPLLPLFLLIPICNNDDTHTAKHSSIEQAKQAHGSWCLECEVVSFFVITLQLMAFASVFETIGAIFRTDFALTIWTERDLFAAGAAG